MSGKLLRAWNKLGSSGESINSSFTGTAFEVDYEMTDRVLDKNSRCELRVGRAKSTLEEVTVQVINKEGRKRGELRRLKEEFRVLRKVRHDNVVAVYDIYEVPEAFYVVTENLPWPSLLDLLTDKHRFEEEDVREILGQLCSALKYCKDEGVVHRNIKPDNILYSKVDGKITIKLKDFRWSKELEQDMMSFKVLQTMCGTPIYVAPEILSGAPYNYKCDVWGVGFVAFLLLSNGFPPFRLGSRGGSKADYYTKLRKCNWDFRPRQAWARISLEARDLLKNLIVSNPDRRFSYEQILCHPWFRKKVLKPDVEISELGIFGDDE